MMSCSPRFLSLLLTLILLPASVGADEIERREDAPQPKSPQDSLTHFHVPDDVEVELVAAEPLLSDPTSIAWDERGRLFVSEIHGYNLEGHLDVQELNRSGKLDTVVRRIPASDHAKEAADKETFGTIRLLEDTDGDGRMDASSVFADQLPPCHGLIAARGGIIAVGRPDIIWLADHDGNGRAEVREVLFTGFEITILERSINNPRWGIDNWIYVSAGAKGGHISGPQLAKPVALGATDFRFRPDGSAIEPVTGRNSMFGQTMTDWGDRFVTPPGLYAVPIPQKYLARNPYLPSPHVNANAAQDNRLYPTSQPHPWRVERNQQQEWNKFYSDRYGSSEAASNGFFTSACGQMIYRADWLPQRYHGNHFCCDPAQNLIHRRLLSRNGLRFEAVRAPDEQQSEFLSSTDQWFRPTNLATGPDGGLYIVDMYREIIEDYSAIPRYLQQQYGLIEGRRHGRIWRVLPKNATSDSPDIPSAAGRNQRVRLLEHPNAWQRLTAQRLLIEEGHVNAIVPLRTMTRSGNTPQARLHALYTLAGLQPLKDRAGAAALTVQELLGALQDPHFAVRLHGLRLAEPWLSDNTVLEAALRLKDDEDAKVRLQLALTLGESADPRVVGVLAGLVRRDGADAWMRAAILSSSTERAGDLLTAVVASAIDVSENRDSAQQLLQLLSAVIGSQRRDDEIGRLLQTVTEDLSGHTDLQADCLTGLLEGLERGSAQELTSASGRAALQQLVFAKSTRVRSVALRIAGATRFSESAEMAALFEQAALRAADDNQSLEARTTAVEILASAPDAMLIDTVAPLLNSQHSAALQLAAVTALAGSDASETSAVLLTNWDSATPAVRQAILNAVFSRVDRLPGLLNALDDETISPRSLSAVQRSLLLEHNDPDVRSRAARLLETMQPTIDPQLLQKYQAALGKTADVPHGRIMFDKTCGGCHTINGRNRLVGPDLSVIQTRSDETVLLDILQPSGKISAGFRSYVVVDSSGRTYSGVLSSETATSVTLTSAPAVRADGSPTKSHDQTILRRDIDVIRGTEQSLMPDRMHEQLTPQDVVDVLAYVRTTLSHQPKTRLLLFDDDPRFASLLDQGTGQIHQELLDAFSGTAAIRVTPPQKHSSAISGWGFPIRETPGDGEYRYLRLAWKTNDGHGVLVELAADGGWPAASDSARRYYSGTNTTNWAAHQVSEDVPDNWTVITCDLWKDCGEFTLTGIAPTAMGGDALFDRIELLQTLDARP